MKGGRSVKFKLVSFLAPTMGLCSVAFLLIFCGLSVLSSFSLLEVLCIGLLTTFALACSLSAYHLVEEQTSLILSPMPWLLLSSAAYFGIGPLIYFFGNEVAKNYCNDVWPVSLEDLFQVTLLNIVGVVFVFVGWLWQSQRQINLPPRVPRVDTLLRPIALFYLVGLPAKIVTVLSECDLLGFTAPGFLGWIGNLTSAGLVLLTALAFRRGSNWWLLWGVLLAFELVGGIVTFSKTSIILAILPCIFGYILWRPDGKGIFWIPSILLVAYLLSYFFVVFARGFVLESNSISTRINVAQTFLVSDDKERLVDGSQMWWARLNYANAQTFAKYEYDNGNPGDSLKMALIAPIPRMLWPGKPLIESGRGFYERLTSRRSASFGMGFFAEAYWNGGWISLIVCSTAIGWFFAKITAIVKEELGVGRFWILPIGLLWVRGGARVDGWIHTEIVGPAVFTAIVIVALRYLLGHPKLEIARLRRLRKGKRLVTSR